MIFNAVKGNSSTLLQKEKSIMNNELSCMKDAKVFKAEKLKSEDI